MASEARHHTRTTNVAWLDEEEMSAWLAMVNVNAAIQAAVEEDFAPHGLNSGEYGVLARLSDAPDHRLRMCDLAEGLHVSPSGLTRRLDGLVREGLVAREQSAEDRRVMMAVLTDKGFERLKAVAPDHVATVRRVFIDHLSRTQLRNFVAALHAVINATSSENTAAS
jgi:DNA-binding MarR family transcriptional regulator